MRYHFTRRRGLTLIELIVALLVLHVVLLILVQTIVSGLQTERSMSDTAQAMLVGQAAMDAVLRNAASQGVSLVRPEGVYPAVPIPVDAELLGLDPAAVEGFKMQTTVAPHEGSDALREVTVSLTWKAKERDRHIEFVSLAPVEQ
jgi:prepilin-type N-terminal cleavage/methylation domain-containing protein